MTLKLKSALLTLEELKVTRLAYKQKICKNYTDVEALGACPIYCNTWSWKFFSN